MHECKYWQEAPGHRIWEVILGSGFPLALQSTPSPGEDDRLDQACGEFTFWEGSYTEVQDRQSDRIGGFLGSSRSIKWLPLAL